MEPKLTTLLPHHVAELARSGITADTARRAGVYSVTDPSEGARLLGWKKAAHAQTPALAFPFRRPDGSPIGVVQLKPDQPRRRDGKVCKYEWPLGVSPQAYFPPGVTPAILADPAVPLIVTEGIKKALAADQAGFRCIGLIGVDGWSRSRNKVGLSQPRPPRELLPELADIVWNGRTVTIVFDSDAVSNPEVARAELALCGILFQQGANVRIARLTPGVNPQGEPIKAGLDDFLVAHSAEALDALLKKTHAAPADWCRPAPINQPAPVSAFPLSVFPEPLAEYARQVAWSGNSPVDFVTVPMLAVAGGAIANARTLALTASHEQSACLWTVTIGETGSGKSPCLDAVTAPIEAAESRAVKEWRQQMQSWREAGPESGSPKPVCRRTLLDDVTCEAMSTLLDKNPRGLLMIRDELVALVCGLNQYKAGKGNDRQVFLKLWSHGSIRVDRNKDTDAGPIHVHRPFVGIVGGIQPTVVPLLRGGRGEAVSEDGFLDRFLFSYPARVPAIGEQWREVDPQSASVWANVVAKLLGLSMSLDVNTGEPQPRSLKLDQTAMDRWAAFTDRHAAELNHPDFLPALRGPFRRIHRIHSTHQEIES